LPLEFQAVPTISLTSHSPLCPAGAQRLVLVEVVEKELAGPTPGETVPKLLWRFHTAATDFLGRPYEIVVFTGLSYGHPNARLTWLLDMLLPHRTAAEREALDTDTLIGTEYDAIVKHAPGFRDPKRTYAEIQFLKPAGG
jgi:hypothetical protein